MKATVLTIIAVLLVGSLGWWVANRGSEPSTGAVADRTHLHASHEERTALDSARYWTCPMHPQVRQHEPGSCPICGMKLVERSEREREPYSKPGAVVEIDPRMAQNLGMRTAVVESGALPRRIRAVGSVQLNEHRIVTVEARAPGWVERLNVRAVGESVGKGQVVAEINAPELRAALEELELAQRLGEPALVDAARRRLELLGASRVASEGAKGRIAIVAPQGGIVTELSVREGAQVTPGVSLMKITDLDSVWIVIDVPETDADAIAVGAESDATVKGVRGKTFRGVVEYVYPLLDPQTRTVRARLVVDNHRHELKPGMFADITVSGSPSSDAILVPSEAVIRTGARNVVIVAEAEGRYRPVEVEIGEERGDRIVVLSGVASGERVVVSGQFLIDSEASLLGLHHRAADDSPAARMRLMGEEHGPTVYGGKPEEESP